MVQVTITPDLHIAAGKLAKLATADLTPIIDEIANAIAPTFEAALKDRAPKRTGEGAASIHVTVQLGGAGRSAQLITTALSRMKYVLEGTSPHFIAPVSARALAWADEGGTLYFDRVGHTVSGIKANDFVAEAWSAEGPALYAEARDAGLRMWRVMATVLYE